MIYLKIATDTNFHTCNALQCDIINKNFGQSHAITTLIKKNNKYWLVRMMTLH